MNGVTKRKSSKATIWYVEYRCKGCQAVAIRGEKLETIVVEDLFNDDQWVIGQAKVGEGDTADLVQQLRETEVRIAQLAQDHYVNGVIDRDVFLTTKAELDARSEIVRHQIAEAEPVEAWASWFLAMHEWDQATTHRKRALLERSVNRVIVFKGQSSKDRVKIERRGTEPGASTPSGSSSQLV